MSILLSRVALAGLLLRMAWSAFSDRALPSEALAHSSAGLRADGRQLASGQDDAFAAGAEQEGEQLWRPTVPSNPYVTFDVHSSVLRPVQPSPHFPSSDRPAPSACSEVQTPATFCSLGQQMPFVGEFSARGVFEQGARARAYGKELIFMQPSFASPTSRDMALNSLLMLRRLGFSHWLLLMQSRTWCEEASSFFGGDSGCIHIDLNEEPYAQLVRSIAVQPVARASWFFRVLGVVRLARAGYNVFVLDSDCVVLHDWYRVPRVFPGIHFWGLQDHASPANINTGTYYIRGAHPDGPIVWALYQMMDWMARWHERPTWLHAVRDELGYQIEDFEQNLIAYAFIMARAGHVPQLALDPSTGFWFRRGLDMASLTRAGTSDASMLHLRLPRPSSGTEWRNFSAWRPPPSELGVPQALQPADMLRGRWERALAQPGHSRHLHKSGTDVNGRRSRHTGKTLSSAASMHAGLHAMPWSLPTGPRLRSAALGTADSNEAATAHALWQGEVVEKAYQLVVPSGTYSTADNAAVEQLLATRQRTGNALEGSISHIRDAGKLFFPVFPAERGNLSQWALAFLDEGRKGASRVRPWPQQGAGAGATPASRASSIVEIQAEAPHWMFSHYLAAQLWGLWDVHGSPPKTVVAHAVFATSTAAKATVLKMYRWWQWDLLPQPPRPEVTAAGRKGLLALAPGLLWWTQSSVEMLAAFMELVLLASLLDRRAVMPPVACSNPWLHANNRQSDRSSYPFAAGDFQWPEGRICFFGAAQIAQESCDDIMLPYPDYLRHLKLLERGQAEPADAESTTGADAELPTATIRHTEHRAHSSDRSTERSPYVPAPAGASSGARDVLGAAHPGNTLGDVDTADDGNRNVHRDRTAAGLACMLNSRCAQLRDSASAPDSEDSLQDHHLGRPGDKAVGPFANTQAAVVREFAALVERAGALDREAPAGAGWPVLFLGRNEHSHERSQVLAMEQYLVAHDQAPEAAFAKWMGGSGGYGRVLLAAQDELCRQRGSCSGAHRCTLDKLSRAL